MKTPSWFLHRNLTAYLLWPLSVIYYLISKIVHWIRNAKRETRNATFVVCVGNILAGGVGKTPVVRELAEKIPNSAIVMRGYRGKKSGRVLRSDTVETVGDEAKMLADFGCDVFVGANRNDSINAAARAGFTTIIMDDGFQNPTVRKDFSIVVFDGRVGIGNGFILPAGPLREPVHALKRADAVIVIGRQETGDRRQGFIKKLTKYNKPVFYARHVAEKIKITNKNIVAFSGIGYPEKFFALLRATYPEKNLETIPFADHHAYTDEDIKKLMQRAAEKSAAIITTEKDKVKIKNDKILILPIVVEIDNGLYKLIKNVGARITRPGRADDIRP